MFIIIHHYYYYLYFFTYNFHTQQAEKADMELLKFPDQLKNIEAAARW